MYQQNMFCFVLFVFKIGQITVTINKCCIYLTKNVLQENKTLEMESDFLYTRKIKMGVCDYASSLKD